MEAVSHSCVIQLAEYINICLASFCKEAATIEKKITPLLECSKIKQELDLCFVLFALMHTHNPSYGSVLAIKLIQIV